LTDFATFDNRIS